jgi:hypothetical protein
MAKKPISGVIGRALAKGGRLEDLIAVPMLFEADSQRGRAPREFLQTEGPHGIYYPLSNVTVTRIWYRENSIEIELNNRMQVSIETNPLTLAIRLKTQSDEEARGFFQVQLIGHDEGESTASLVEERIKRLRQVYAIACLAYGDDATTTLNPSDGASVTNDFEAYLNPDDRLLLRAVGQGSTWATVGLSVIAAAKAAPKAALVAISTIFRGGPDRIVRVSEALVSEREGIAHEANAKGRLEDVQVEKGNIELQSARVVAGESRTREALTTEKQRFDLQAQKIDKYFDIRHKIAEMEDGAPRAALLAALDNSVVSLLGDSAKEWMKLPPSST